MQYVFNAVPAAAFFVLILVVVLWINCDISGGVFVNGECLDPVGTISEVGLLPMPLE